MRDGRVDAGLRMTHEPAGALDLRATLAGLAQWGADPTCRRGAEGSWFALRTEEGSATLLLREVGRTPGDVGGAGGTPDGVGARGRVVDARAWGPGAQAALARVPGMCGALDDAEGFDAGAHPLVEELHRRSPGLRLARTGLVAAALLQAVFFQKVTGKEASQSWSRLVRTHGERAPGPAPAGLTVLPTTAQWRRIPSWEWHRAGVTPQRRDTIQRVLVVADSLERLAAQSAEEASRALRSIPGVGVWTAAETVQRSHGDPDAVSFGDYHVAKTVGWALTGARADDDGMRELLEPWRGHRQRVVRLISRSGISYERHGPKMTIPAHRSA